MDRKSKLKIGDKVIYDGDLSHAFDPYTKVIMKGGLLRGHTYTISYISTYDGEEACDFEEDTYGNSNCWSFPCKSFYKYTEVDLLYGLK